MIDFTFLLAVVVALAPPVAGIVLYRVKPEFRTWWDGQEEFLKAYFLELKLEMKRVTWPNRKQVEGTTAIVILTVFAFAAYFKVVDSVLVEAVNGVQRAFTK